MRALMLSLVALAMLSGGCKKKEVETPKPAPAAPAAKAPIIAPVHFETGVKTVAATEFPVVDEAAQIMRTTDWNCLVVGLADAAGDDASNKILSQERAQAVATLLLQKSGVPSARITAHGIGEKLATSTTVNERKVEFVFYHDTGLPIKQIVVNSRVLEEDFRNRR